LDLVKGIKGIVCQFQNQKYLPQALHEAKRRFYNCYQKPGKTVAVYLETFQNMVDVVEQSGGHIGIEPKIAEEIADDEGVDMATGAEADKARITRTAQSKCLAAAFILG
jgi:hypothetical protein